jgi:2-C-methyl-D-erythritol 4-phosphate cytidylyltransferase / 2-C-methyl-D-erythritol 2,4-cyclodiphosphate synthase
MKAADTVWGAVVVGAGSGSRFGGGVPKQFLPLGGVPVLTRSVRLFTGIADLVAVVIPASGALEWCAPEGVITVSGGARRQDSVLNGVRELSSRGATHILVHDGARPVASGELIHRVMQAAHEYGAAVPCIAVRDTVKRVDGGFLRGTIDRRQLRLSQTPQGFRVELLLEALEKAGDVTDEASALEAIGIPVREVPGDALNIKLTEREDMPVLQSLIDPGERSHAAGIDFHPFCADRPLFLCGCRLSGEGGLMGHSDGDVVLHAVADGVLAASRTGDIGTLFPSGDQEWKGADSSVLLCRCAGIAAAAGWLVERVDVTVVGEKPAIAPIREKLIERLAGVLNLPVERVWIKGTTTNTIGELARGAGLGCLALVSMVRTGQRREIL